MKRKPSHNIPGLVTMAKKNHHQLPKNLTRKELRKQARMQKKSRKHAFFSNRLGEKLVESMAVALPDKAENKIASKKDPIKDLEKEKLKKQCNLEKLQLKRRKQFMLEENEREEKHIAMLEKRLKINKRKSKSMPQLFVKDGLDYLLDVCDSQKIPHLREPELSDADSDFHDDFAMATGQTEIKTIDAGKKKKKVTFECMPKFEEDSKGGQSEEFENASEEDKEPNADSEEDSASEMSIEESADEGENEDDLGDNIDFADNCGNEKEDDVISVDSVNDGSDSENVSTKKDQIQKKKKDSCWEDIYGRLRDKDGNVLENTKSDPGRYVPPALRRTAEKEDAKKAEVLLRLRRQLKGLLNRLSESNINPITTEIEALYMRNARNDMNDTLIKLIMEAIVQPAHTPERLVQEHAMLIALLHANVGTEVGAQFLEAIVDRFACFRKQGENYGDGKECDNLLQLLVHMYSFKVIHSVLIYDILQILADSFKEKDVELILLVLRLAGFSLRKDDPLCLKSVIVKIQSRASAGHSMEDQSRIRFMLDTLMAIRNNNMHKIPNYDPSHTEHLKKLLRSLIRKGNCVIELKISLDDLLNVETRGRWWVVGSAWSGQAAMEEDKKSESGKMAFDATDNVSDKILELARRQRMNTDVRRNIFCVIMTAEDYVDAFEKLSRLGLNNQQEREIIHVTIECCLQEKTFNPYYAFLMQRFCHADRKYQMIIQFSVWDKIKELDSVTAVHLSNLAHLLTHLFLEKALAISVLKVIEFAEMDKALVRFLRQILLEILLHDPEEVVLAVFSKVAKSPKLHMFREGLRLFMHHFVLRNKDKLPSEAHQKLEARIEAVENVLTSCEVATKF